MSSWKTHLGNDLCKPVLVLVPVLYRNPLFLSSVNLFFNLVFQFLLVFKKIDEPHLISGINTLLHMLFLHVLRLQTLHYLHCCLLINRSSPLVENSFWERTRVSKENTFELRKIVKNFRIKWDKKVCEINIFFSSKTASK